MGNENEALDPINWVGEIDPVRLRGAGFAWWHESKTDFDAQALASLRESFQVNAGQFELIAFLGVWCPDCQEQMPEFFSLIEAARIPWSSVKLIGTLRDKRFLPWTETLALQRLPTYVVLQGGKEIGRVTEYPKATLIEDLAEILETQVKAG